MPDELRLLVGVLLGLLLAEELLLADELELAEEEALADAVADAEVAACRAGFFFAVFDFGDFAGWTAASSRAAPAGRAEQAPFTMGEPPATRSVVTEPNTVELVERISVAVTAPSAADLSATALTT